MNFRLSKSTINILLVLAMKVLVKTSEYVFGTLAPANFEHADNGTTCRLLDKVPDFSTKSTSLITWLYSCRAVLPVFGGLLANACLGYVLALNFGGAILVLSTSLLSIAVYKNFICYPSSAIVLITWILVTVQYGIVQPSIMYGLYKWHIRQPRMWTILTGAYYSALKFGGCIALLLPQLSSSIGVPGGTLICAGFSAAFLALSFLLNREEPAARTSFLMPTTARVISYSKAFTFMALFSVSIADTQSVFYSVEINYFLGNATAALSEDEKLAFSPELIKLVAQVIWGLALMLAAYLRPSQLPMEPRLYGGILLETLVTVGLLLVVSLAPPRSLEAVHAIYATACVLDGAAEILTISAGYEIMLGVAQSANRILVFGMCFTVWGLANLAGRGLVEVLSHLPTDNPVLRPSIADSNYPHNQFFIYHLVILVTLVMSLAHYRFSGHRIVTMQFMTEVDMDSIYGISDQVTVNSTGEEETDPLLSSN